MSTVDPIRIRAIEIFPKARSASDFPQRWCVQGINVAGIAFESSSLGRALDALALAIRPQGSRGPVEIEVEWSDPFRDPQLFRCEFIPGRDRWGGLGRLLRLKPVIQIKSFTNLE